MADTKQTTRIQLTLDHPSDTNSVNIFMRSVRKSHLHACPRPSVHARYGKVTHSIRLCPDQGAGVFVRTAEPGFLSGPRCPDCPCSFLTRALIAGGILWLR